MAKDYEDDISLFEELLKEYEEEEAAEEVGESVKGDNINVIRQQVQSGGGSGGGGKGGGLFGTLANIGAKAALGAATGGASTAVGTGIPFFMKEGGQIKSKTKKKKRVVRGVGAAKRGYGKATYSKKMY
tara:strand:- start:770 stop:1156 length:387 start_codon:yes stop_codon:yes gene_type:complete